MNFDRQANCARKTFKACWAIALEGAYYALFEWQNAWSFNEKEFGLLQLVTLIAIACSLALLFIKPFQALSPVPLVLALVLTTVVSNSPLNLWTLLPSLFIIALIFVVAMTLRTRETKPAEESH